MGIFAWIRRAREPQRTIVRTYGRGSLLGILSLPIAFVMARAGMHGWEDSAAQAMQKELAVMTARAYHVVSADKYTVPAFGFVYFKVCYELSSGR